MPESAYVYVCVCKSIPINNHYEWETFPPSGSVLEMRNICLERVKSHDSSHTVGSKVARICFVGDINEGTRESVRRSLEYWK